MHAHIHEGAKVRNVRHDARQHLPHPEVRNLVHRSIEGKLLERLARVASGLLQLGHDVAQRGHSHVFRHVATEVYPLPQLLVAEQLFDGAVSIASHLPHQFVALGVHRTAIQRLAAFHTQKSGTLLEGLCAQTRHTQQVATRTERPVLRTVAYDACRQCRPQSAHISQQPRAGRIEVHAHTAHARDHGLVEALSQLRLVHILLVLPHSDAAGVYLHEFCQRVHESATYGDGSAHGDILVGELLARNVAGAVDAGAVLADAIHLHALGQVEVADEVLRLATCRSVADGDGLHTIALHHSLHGQHGLHAFVLGRMRENNVVMQQCALLVETHHLAARAESRVDGHDTLLSQRWRHEQLLQSEGKDADGLFVGSLLGRSGKLGRNAWLQQPLVSVLHCLAHQLRGFAVALHEHAADAFDGRCVIHRNRHAQHAFCLAAPHGQQSVAATACQRLAPLEPRAEVLPLGILATYDATLYHRMMLECVAQALARPLVLAHALCYDVLRALDGLLGRLDAFFLINIAQCSLADGCAVLCLNDVGQRLQARLASHLRLRAALLFEGQVEVFQLAAVPARFDAAAQFVGQFILRLDALQDEVAAFLQFRQFVQQVAYLTDFHFRHAACGFLAVASDERNGGSVLQQVDGVLHELFLQSQPLRNYKSKVHSSKSMFKSRLCFGQRFE